MGRRRSYKRILILCEGFTEDVYAKTLRAQLPRDKQRMISVEIVRHKQNDPSSLLSEARKRSLAAKREKNAYDTIWLFFDHDNSPHLEKVFEGIEKEQFEIAYSSICIEHWFILHFEDCGRNFGNAEATVKHLKNLWPSYHKTKVNHFNELKPNLKVAISRAEQLCKEKEKDYPILNRQPYTTIHRLVAFFRNLNDE